MPLKVKVKIFEKGTNRLLFLETLILNSSNFTKLYHRIRELEKDYPNGNIVCCIED